MTNTIVSPHIEKTAGTTVERLYCDLFGPENVVLYSPFTERFRQASDELIPRTSEFIDGMKHRMGRFPLLYVLNKLYNTSKRACQDIECFDDIRVVHGHFDANQVQIPGSLLAIVFRNPLNRMISQYAHWRRAKGELEWRVTVPYDHQMAFEEYAMLPTLQNYQTQTMAGHDVSDFEFVGVCERLDVFALKVASFARDTYGVTGNVKVARLNRSPAHNIQVDQDFEQVFQRYHSDDYEVYDKVLSLM